MIKKIHLRTKTKENMKDKYRKGIFLSVFCIFIINLFLLNIFSASSVNLYIFYGKGCPHCAKAISYLNNLESEYPSLNIIKYEVYFNESNRVLLEKLAKAYNHNVEGVPTIFIDDKIIVGFGENTKKELEDKIESCIKNNCLDPMNKIKDTGDIKNIEKIKNKDIDNKKIIQKLTIPAVISAAVVDAINPCAFAVLIILLMTILATKKRKRALYAGFSFSLAIYISYFLMGIGLYSAIESTGIGHSFFMIVSILAIILGLFNIKDYFFYGKWFLMEVPLSWRPKLKSLLRGVTSVPGAFGIGFIVSLFLLPCTSGPYIVILGLLSKLATRNQAIRLLLLYNFIFILPMLIITLSIYYGLTTVEKAEKLRQKRLKTLHLVAGIILIALGIIMLISLYKGLI